MKNEARVTWIREQLTKALQPTVLNIYDDSHKHQGHEGAKGGAGHFTVEIASPKFEGKTLLECHRMIYKAVESAMPHDIHALKIVLIKNPS